MTQSILIRNGTIVTMDQHSSIVRGDVLIRDGRIAEVGETIDADVDEKIDASGSAVLPGFVQTHIHLCQTLFRGAADDLFRCRRDEAGRWERRRRVLNRG